MQERQMSFYDEALSIPFSDMTERVMKKTARDVEAALARDDDSRDLDDFAALISPAARPFLMQIAQKSFTLTRRRFGSVINMYLPLYLTNLCSNDCSYCGFSSKNKIERKCLTPEETDAECRKMHEMGYENFLLVSGEHKDYGIVYFAEMMPIVRKYASFIQFEVQPLQTEDYTRLRSLGLDAVCVYQETYNPEMYKLVHRHGMKKNMRFRMETPERVGEAGVEKVGLGALLGLSEWHADSMFVAMHAKFMRKHYWNTKVAISFPRLRPACGGFEPGYPLSDRDLIQLMCAFRLFDPELELTISTRERPAFRDAVVPMAITAISAGSSVQPGGYVERNDDLAQWKINDSRPVEEVCAALKRHGLDLVWRDTRVRA